jgi:hypothetical protein
MIEEQVEGWRLALAAELDRRAARDSVRRELAERRRCGVCGSAVRRDSAGSHGSARPRRPARTPNGTTGVADRDCAGGSSAVSRPP